MTQLVSAHAPFPDTRFIERAEERGQKSVTHSAGFTAAPRAPCRRVSASASESSSSESSSKPPASGGNPSDRVSVVTPSAAGATCAVVFFIAAKMLRTCLRAVRGSRQPRHSQAVSVSICAADEFWLRYSIRPSHLNGLLGIRKGGRMRRVYGLFFDVGFQGRGGRSPPSTRIPRSPGHTSSSGMWNGY
jgi:hypothetical protein